MHTNEYYKFKNSFYKKKILENCLLNLKFIQMKKKIKKKIEKKKNIIADSTN